MASFSVRVQPLDGSVFEVPVAAELTVSDLQDLIYAKTFVPSHKQRLLHHGKLLKAEDSLRRLHPHDTVLLVAELGQLPESVRVSVERRTHPLQPVSPVQRSEVLHQNTQTLEMLLNALQPSGEFDLKARHFVIGQWVDVKDTVDQWLEASVIDKVRIPQGTYVYVHYHEWPSHWDEWISTASPRIQPFRTRTVQPVAATTQSPSAATSTPANHVELELVSAIGIVDSLQRLLPRQRTSALLPLLDRGGRLLSDLAAAISAENGAVMPPTSVLAAHEPIREIGVHLHAVTRGQEVVPRRYSI